MKVGLGAFGAIILAGDVLTAGQLPALADDVQPCVRERVMALMRVYACEWITNSSAFEDKNMQSSIDRVQSPLPDGGALIEFRGGAQTGSAPICGALEYRNIQLDGVVESADGEAALRILRALNNAFNQHSMDVQNNARLAASAFLLGRNATPDDTIAPAAYASARKLSEAVTDEVKRSSDIKAQLDGATCKIKTIGGDVALPYAIKPIDGLGGYERAAADYRRFSDWTKRVLGPALGGTHSQD